MRQDPGLTVAAAGPDDLSPVRELLAANGLPVQDLVDPVGVFLIARSDGAFAGVVGLEAHGPTALLRSLCVPAERRRQGVARLLCAAVESVARGLQVRELCLLTTTARAFFERQGFVVAPRDSATPVLRESSQFRDLCPSSATFMRKPLAPAGARYLPRRLLTLEPDVPGARMWKVALDRAAMTYFEVDGGVRFERHAHEGEQITTVVEGELFFELDGTTIRVGPGDAIAIPPGVPHAVFTRDKPARAFDAWAAPFPPANL
jgi:N-acetylglutamate synthase-like GNAT family acetyltransferase/mannose-6-phosphate isomerase-like protein (cupin superfamily)